jgi:hypothetical protein
LCKNQLDFKCFYDYINKGKLLENQTLSTHLNPNNNCIHNIFTEQKWKIVLKKIEGIYIFIYIFCPGVDQIKSDNPLWFCGSSIRESSQMRPSNIIKKKLLLYSTVEAINYYWRINY